MGKSKVKTINLTDFKEKVEELILDERERIIKSAEIKDDFCKYSFEPLKGYGKGDTHNVTGAAIIHDDMREAMKKLNIHLAVIDDAFKTKMKKKDTDIKDLLDDDLTELYHVTGIKIKGNDDDEKVVLIGTKFVSVGGRIDLETPPIHLSLSAYKWYNELKTDVDAVRKEVEEYMNGKCTPVEEEEEDKAQIKMQFEQPLENGEKINDNEFEAAKV